MIVVGDEQIDPSLRRAGKLNRIGGLDAPVLAYRRIVQGRLAIERYQRSGLGQSFPVRSLERFVFLLRRLDQYLAERQRGRKQLIAPSNHPPPQGLYFL